MAIECARWNKYNDDIKNNLKIIIVDDGSKVPAHTLSVSYPHNVSIYRIKKDIVWNEKGARNLGAVVADTEWVIFTDFDHFFLEKDIDQILNYIPSTKTAYRFNRRSVDETPKNVHSESFLIERIRAIQAGLFSECYTGLYGAGPYQMFYKRFQEQGNKFEIMSDVVIYQRSNKNNAPRNGDVTGNKKYDANYGILHFEWQKTL